MRVTNAAEGLRKLSTDQGLDNTEADGDSTKALWVGRVLEPGLV